jgi:hypothetical protein
MHEHTPGHTSDFYGLHLSRPQQQKNVHYIYIYIYIINQMYETNFAMSRERKTYNIKL